jgi:hypothetical protein
MLLSVCCAGDMPPHSTAHQQVAIFLWKVLLYARIFPQVCKVLLLNGTADDECDKQGYAPHAEETASALSHFLIDH